MNEQLPSFYNRGSIDLKGEKGDKGDKGDQGDIGPRGPRGLPGTTPDVTDITDINARSRLSSIEADYATRTSLANVETTVAAYADEIEATASRIQVVEADYTTAGQVLTIAAAKVLEETLARSTELAAEATARDTLAATLRRETDDKVLTVSGLVTDERNARVTALGAVSERIGLVEASFVTIADVNAKVSEESTARANALGAEAQRVDTLLANYAKPGDIDTKVSAAITAEQQARASAVSAEAIRVDQLVANFVTSGTVDSKVSAAITAEQQARSTAIGAEASRVDGIVANFVTAGTVDSKVSAAIQAEQSARTTAIGAEASRVDQLLANYATPGTVDAKVSAAITAEQQARAGAIGAEASRVDGLLVNYATNAALSGYATPANITAAINAESSARANAIGAEASRVNGLLASYSTLDNVENRAGAYATAALQEANRVSANALGAQITRIDQATATADGASAFVTAQTNVNADLYGRTAARWGITADNGTGRAQLSIYADGYGAGVDITGNVRIYGNLLVAGTVNTDQLTAGSVSGCIALSGAGFNLQPNQAVNSVSGSITTSSTSAVRVEFKCLSTYFTSQGGSGAPYGSVIRTINGVETEVLTVRLSNSGFQDLWVYDFPPAGTASYTLRFRDFLQSGSGGYYTNITQIQLGVLGFKR